MENYNTPILFIIFNRKDTAQRVFNKIKEIKPKKLYVAADGPRRNRKDDIENCKKTRDIINQVDWDCDLKTLFREENLGCGKGVSGAISWLFENEDRGIILEDDCLANDDFFVYCDDLLNRYKDNDTIKIISGDNFQNGNKRGESSYYFSSYANIWGWATWRRFWREYEYDLNKYSIKELKSFYNPYSISYESRLYWKYRAQQMKKHQVDTWDYQLQFSIWRKKGLNIIPNCNLIQNIGFDSNATHTSNMKDNSEKSVKTQNILPLIYNDNIKQNKVADKYFHNRYEKKALWKYPILFLKLYFSNNK